MSKKVGGGKSNCLIYWSFLLLLHSNKFLKFTSFLDQIATSKVVHT
jgi:hypothetical protein